MIEIPNQQNGSKILKVSKTISAKVAVPKIPAEMITDKKKSNHIDKLIGGRIRRLRLLNNISMKQLAALLGISHQQITKYESGNNRVAAGMLYRIAKIFNVEIAHFFRTASEDSIRSTDEKIASSGISQGKIPNARSPNSDSREVVSLIRNYYKIADPKIRRKMFELIKGLGK